MERYFTNLRKGWGAAISEKRDFLRRKSFLILREVRGSWDLGKNVGGHGRSEHL